MTKANSFGRRKGWINRLRHRGTMRDTTGSSIVELALLVPIFTALLIGSSEFAILTYDSLEVTSAARAGVAYGSQSSATAADTAGMQSAAVNSAPDVAGLSATARQFWSCSDAPATQSNSIPTCTAGNHVLNYVQVTTTATITPGIHLAGLSASYALNGSAIMRVQ